MRSGESVRWLVAALVAGLALMGPARAGNLEDCKSGDPDRMIRGCSRIIKAGDSRRNLAAAYNNRGVASYARGDYDLALADYDQAVRLKPDDVSVYNNRGNAYGAKGDLDRAVADYDQAIRFKPDEARAFAGLADVHQEKGDLTRARVEREQAVALHSRALAVNPRDADVSNGRAWALYRLGEAGRGLADANRAIELSPRTANYYDTRGHILVSIGLPDEAIADFDKALSLGLNFPSSYYGRGLAYEGRGDIERARADYRRAAAFAEEKLNLEQRQLRRQAQAALDRLDASAPVAPPALPVVTAAAPTAAAGLRAAFVVGVDAYDNLGPDRQLRKAVNDARAVGDALGRLGFSVTRSENVTRSAFNRAWQGFLANVAPGGVAAVFFAGHGVQIEGANYLLPRDVPQAAEGGEGLLESESVSLARLLGDLRKRGPRVSLLIIDACRDNPFLDARGRSVGGTRGLARAEPPEGAFVLFSAGAGESALDRLSETDPERTSVYTRSLLPLLATPGLSLQDVAVKVRETVRALAARAGHRQTPAYYDEMAGPPVCLVGECR